jgi:hypothetical protein
MRAMAAEGTPKARAANPRIGAAKRAYDEKCMIDSLQS